MDVYSTDTDSGLLTVIRNQNGKFERVAQIRVGNAPRGSVKFTPDGRGFVSNTSTNTVSEIDALTHKEVGRIEVGSGPRGLHLVGNNKYLLVSNSGSDTISVVDLNERREVLELEVGRDPRHMIVAGGNAYVCLWGEGALAKIDVSGLDVGDIDSVKLLKKITIGEDTFPYSLNVDKTRNIALVACNTPRFVPVVDLDKDEVVENVSLRASGARAVAFTNDSKHALVTLERDNSMAVINLDSLEVTKYIKVGPGPRGVTVDETDIAFVALFARPPFFEYNSIEDFASHAVTIVRLSGANLDDPTAEIPLESVRVGFGPCSVSTFDPTKVERRLHEDSKDDKLVLA